MEKQTNNLESFSDLELILNVKEKNDSDCFMELVNRHSGIYNHVINRYSYNPTINKDELLDDKYYNFYKAIMDYDPARGMKFPSYVGERIKYICKSLISSKESFEEISDMNTSLYSKTPDFETEDLISNILEMAEKSKNLDKRFITILKMRHPMTSRKPQTWPVIGDTLGISGERARNIYHENIDKLRDRILKNEKIDC